MFSSKVLHSNKTVTNWTSNGISPEKINLFDTDLESTMSKLANVGGILKLNNSFIMQKNFLYWEATLLKI